MANNFEFYSGLEGTMYTQIMLAGNLILDTKEREREREREGGRERQRDRERQRETERDRERQRETGHNEREHRVVIGHVSKEFS